MYVIAGLGNPGKQYESTRHNIGFISVDYLSAYFKIKLNKLKFKAVYGEGSICGEKVMLVKPQTFMNLSGESLREIVSFYKIPPENLLVIYDDVSLPCGRIRIRPKGSDGGHNGIKSIIYQLGSDVFPRVKLGVGAPPEQWDMADWVTGKFSDEEVKILARSVEKLPEITEEIIEKGTASAMNRFNGKD